MAEWIRFTRYCREGWDRWNLRPMRERKLLMLELCDYMNPTDDEGEVESPKGPDLTELDD